MCAVYNQIDRFKASVPAQPIEPHLYTNYSVKRGLRNENGTGVLVGLTRVGEVFSYYVDDGERLPVDGKLFYRGIALSDLVHGFYDENRFGFEETAYLLIFGELPDAASLAQFETHLAQVRCLPNLFVEDMIFKSPSRDIMNKLARSILALYAYDQMPDDITIENVFRQSMELLAKFPLLVAYAYMAKRHYIDGESLFIHFPNETFNTAQNILQLFRPDGEFSPLEAKILDLALVVHAEHGGGNNSTFTTRCVTSTGTDTYSAIASGICSLKGPQHGGAAGRAYHMMEDAKATIRHWDNEAEVRDYLRALLRGEAYDRSGLVYGIGHAVYTLSDPRARLLSGYAKDLAKEKNRLAEYEFYRLFESLAPEVFDEVKQNGKIVCANVDFYSGFIYNMLGIPEDLFTPIFATARIAGWCAHRLEELISCGRIIRPAYKNVQKRRSYTPFDQRQEDLS